MANSLIEEKVKQYRTQIESSVEALYNITELISHSNSI